MKRFFQRKFSFKLPVIVISVFFFLIACSQVLDPTFTDKGTSSTASGSPSTPASAPSEPVGSPSTPASAPSKPVGSPSAPASAPSELVGSPSTPASAPSKPAGSPSAPASAPSEPAGSPSTPASAPSEPVASPSAPVNPPFEPSNAVLSDYQYNKMQEISHDNQYLRRTLNSQNEEDIPKALHLLQILRDEIVPQSVNKLIATFPKTFGWLQNDYEVGMGVSLSSYVDDSESVVAAFLANYAKGNTPEETVYTDYALSIKYGKFEWNEKTELVEASREELESHVAHEMMHALMCESLSCGFFGITAELEDIAKDQFPKWFTEGCAEAVGGVTGKIWYEITRNIFLPDNIMVDTYVKTFLNTYPLSDAKNAKYHSVYQTGFLATMYLGYLASGKKSMEPQDIAAGLDLLLYKIHCGQSLASVINDISPVLETGEKKYSDIDSFVNNFNAENNEVVSFVTKLLNEAGAEGQGSLIAPSFQEKDILPNDTYETPVFWLHIGKDRLWNKYGETMSARKMFKGGAATKDGVPGLGAQR